MQINNNNKKSKRKNIVKMYVDVARENKYMRYKKRIGITKKLIEQCRVGKLKVNRQHYNILL